jgi:hypothetical protein
MIRTTLILVSFFFVTFPAYSQVFLDADSTGDAYARILSKGYGYEVPDCIHLIRHITEEWNNDLRKYVFVFYAHKSFDNDRCINFDRQRTEIKTWDSSPESLKFYYNETLVNRWKFKLDSAFQPSANFTHIHQIKAGDGTYDTDNPLITVTPVKQSTNKLEIRFMPPMQEGGGTVKLTNVPLAAFLGEWVEAYETVKFDSVSLGTYSIQLKRLSDDSTLLSYTNSGISMWRRGITFCRPKYGIYRSLLDSNSLRDEEVRFADFYLKKGATVTLPSAPSGLAATIVSVNRINLVWTDNSSNEGQFRIDRSFDGSTWSYRSTAKSGTTAYADTGVTAATKYYYRVRAENVYGNSLYSNIVSRATGDTISASSGLNGTIQPSGAIFVNYGANQHFSIVPNTNYHVDSLIIDGVRAVSDTQHTFTSVTTAHTIRATFAFNSYTITASSGTNGYIIPSGVIGVDHGGDQAFTFAPSSGYHVDSVFVDGEYIDSVNGYTFKIVTANHSIAVTYAVNTYIITSIAGIGGSISPSPDVHVNHGSSQIFIVTADPGYQIDSILIDGAYRGNSSPDTIKNVTANHTIRCVFGIIQARTLDIGVADKWNLVSVPLRMITYTKTAVYPTAISEAYRYQGGYISQATLSPGIGYWIKFDGAQIIQLTGYIASRDTFDLMEGWNIIGSLSSTVAVKNIITNTPGLTLSQFFEYKAGYVSADSLRSGAGYWVKSSVAGQIILDVSSQLIGSGTRKMKFTK